MTLFRQCIKAQRILLLISSAKDTTKMKTIFFLALLGCSSAFPGNYIQLYSLYVYFISSVLIFFGLSDTESI